METLSLQNYVGMTVEAAGNLAKIAGFEVAVELGSGQQVLNCEYRQGRITFRVTDGIVTSAYRG